MRILVTGREGQVARSLAECASGTDIEIVTLGRPDLDLAREVGSIVNTLTQVDADLIVSAAAYTQVDRAEGEPELAFAINERGAGAVAKAARERGLPLIHLSTDYVFDGLKPVPYVEEDTTGPTGIYGASKLAGEQAVLAEQPNSAVLRTAWVYSPFGTNFVKTMLRLAGNRDEVAVVADQLGNPSSAHDIAEGILAVARNLLSNTDRTLRGTFHMAGSGEATWAEFAKAVFAVSESLGGPVAAVRRISTSEYPTAATRPANSQLDCGKLQRVHGVRMPEWRVSLERVLGKLLQSEL